jgi:hypothetical protein
MAIKYMSMSPFARYTWTSIGMLIAIAIYFVSHVLLEKKIDYAKGIRYQSVLLLTEYRQSLDEQRRMALTYVATGNPVYKKQYQNILDIREGIQVRPERYNQPYLGFVIKEKMSSERPIALLELIRQEGFSEQEYRKLKQADARFVEVNATEQNAMQLIEAAGSDVDVRRARATQMLQDENYQQAITSIMKSINDVSATVTERSLNAAKSAETFSAILKILAILFTFAFVFTGRKAYLALKTQLGGSIDEVQKHVTRISDCTWG